MVLASYACGVGGPALVLLKNLGWHSPLPDRSSWDEHHHSLSPLPAYPEFIFDLQSTCLKRSPEGPLSV